MNISGVRSAIYEIVSRYFAGATVAWGDTNMTKPSLPFITLKLGDVQRAMWPNKKYVDGIPYYDYPSQVRLTMNLFTRGRQLLQGQDMAIREDTSENDMMEFVNFVNSDFFIAWEHQKNIYIRPEGPVRNLTALTNDLNWEYRALAEFVVAYTEIASGATTVWSQNPSGGGSEELADYSDGYFDHVNLDYVNDPIEE